MVLVPHDEEKISITQNRLTFFVGMYDERAGRLFVLLINSDLWFREIF